MAPGGATRATFAQTYTLTPEEAIDLRDENITKELKRTIRREILDTLEHLMRENPYGKTFETAGEQLEKAYEETGQVPHFQVI